MRKRLVSIMMLFIMVIMSIIACGTTNETFHPKLTASEEYDIQFSTTAVHDPSIVKDNDTYYIFGSHLASAKTQDLINWEQISSKVSANNQLMPDAIKAMPETFQWAKTQTLWAPDVIRLADGKYYMYYCACEGSSPLSCLGIAVSDKIDGPYKDQGIILRSGMTTQPSENGDFYDATIYPNVVDPCVFFDAEDKLWMVYGSYSGGIFILELNPDTGRPLESGYGKKLLGENHLRIEGSYIMYNPDTEYYYLFLSFGGLDSDGGYNIRVARSKTPDGPYLDAEGQDMINCKGPANTFFDDEAAEKFGTKLLGGYKWKWEEGEKGEDRKGLLSPGHNSAIYDESLNKYFIIYHTRMESRGESFSVYTNQMFFNAEDWPVVAPYRYTGETIGSYKDSDVAGMYKFLNHGHDINVEMHVSDDIILYSNHKVGGDHEGKWKLTENNQLEITIDDIKYSGVFVQEYDDNGEKYVMTFTAMSSETGECIWGSGLDAVNLQTK